MVDVMNKTDEDIAARLRAATDALNAVLREAATAHIDVDLTVVNRINHGWVQKMVVLPAPIRRGNNGLTVIQSRVAAE